MQALIPGTPLPPQIVELIAHVASPLGADAVVLARQAAAAKVVSTSPTMIDVTVPDDLPALALDDGPLPIEALVHRDGELTGEFLVWVSAGRLAALEQAWYTEQAPASWPGVDQVTLA